MRAIGSGFEEATPVVTLLYEGSSQLHSCQPGIQDYVDTFGQSSTRYGSVTTFDVSGRSAAITLGSDDFGSVNRSFKGLPVASRYTIMIDPSLPANRDLPWDQLEDIEILLGYTYQDLFPQDSTCGRN